MNLTFLSNIFRLRRPKSQLALAIKNKLGLKIKNESLYEFAFTHKSVRAKDKNGLMMNNERLEFLGDAVLGAIVSEMLYKDNPKKGEGLMSDARANIVCRKTLNAIGERLELQNILKVTNSGKNSLGNAFEALIGAVFLDLGYDRCRDFVLDMLKNNRKIKPLLNKEKNYKSMLLEWSQKGHNQVSYDIIEETRLENNRIRFQSRVVIDGKEYGFGVGFSKKEAESNASLYTLRMLKKNDQSMKNV